MVFDCASLTQDGGGEKQIGERRGVESTFRSPAKEAELIELMR